MELTEDIVQRSFPFLREPELIKEIVKEGSLEFAHAGEIIMEVGRYIKSVPLIVRGSIRIMREDYDGRELFLYYLKTGQACAVSLTCCMANEQSSIRAIADEDTELVKIPIEFIDLWTSKYTSFKNFVMNTYRLRYEELLQTIDSIAFLRMDERLWKFIKEKAKTLNTKEIHITHQEIAEALHSTREVISRLLKQLEKKGKITLSRNKVILEK